MVVKSTPDNFKKSLKNPDFAKIGKTEEIGIVTSRNLPEIF